MREPVLHDRYEHLLPDLPHKELSRAAQRPHRAGERSTLAPPQGPPGPAPARRALPRALRPRRLPRKDELPARRQDAPPRHRNRTRPQHAIAVSQFPCRRPARLANASDRARARLAGELDRGLHRPRVRHDLCRVTPVLAPSSALKIARAPAVRFSICDDDAVPGRSKTGANAATRCVDRRPAGRTVRLFPLKYDHTSMIVMPRSRQPGKEITAWRGIARSTRKRHGVG